MIDNEDSIVDEPVGTLFVIAHYQTSILKIIIEFGVNILTEAKMQMSHFILCLWKIFHTEYEIDFFVTVLGYVVTFRFQKRFPDCKIYVTQCKICKIYTKFNAKYVRLALNALNLWKIYAKLNAK